MKLFHFENVYAFLFSFSDKNIGLMQTKTYNIVKRIDQLHQSIV